MVALIVGVFAGVLGVSYLLFAWLEHGTVTGLQRT